MKQTKATLKTFFETGDKPTQEQFGDLIDSIYTEEDIVLNAQKEYAYETLQQLVENNKLIVGQKYILTGYQTKYYIKGSNSSNIEKTIVNKATVNGFGFFDPPLLDLNVGDEIVVTTLPLTYKGPIQVGTSAKVTANVFGLYIQFDNGFQNLIGGSFSYSLQRYSHIAPDSKILDANFKPIMQAKGVVNTEVHDGKPYMQMTAEENKAVPTETIVLTAISANQFSTQAESLTYPGELLEFDFTANKIKNEDGVVIGERYGIITRRISADKKIDINKDWRVQRYRRYKMEEVDWKNYILQNPTTQDVYLMGGHNAVTAANVSMTENHKYVLPEAEEKQFYQDFTNGGKIADVFTNGQDTAPGIAYGYRMETQEDHVFKQDIKVAVANNGKDFFIFPLDDKGQPQEKVLSVVVNNLENTIFLNHNSQFAQDNVIDVKVTDGIKDSTFVTGAKLFSASENRLDALNRITAVDNVTITNKGKIERLTVMTSGVINNSGEIKYLTFAGMPSSATGIGVTYIDVSFDDLCRVRNSMIGGKRLDRCFMNNVQMNKCLLAFTTGQYFKISDSIMYLTAIKHNGNFFTNNVSIDTSDKNIKKSKFGFMYESSTAISGKHIFTNSKADWVAQTLDADNANATSVQTLIESK